jgi:hypothetical protein
VSAVTEPEAEAAEPTVDAAVTVQAVASPRRRGRGDQRVRGEISAWIERRLGLTPAGTGVVVAALAMLVAGRASNSRGLTLTAYGLLMVLATSWLLGRRNLAVDADRSAMPSRVRAGRTIDVEIAVTARRRLTGIVLEERLDPHLGVAVRVPVPVLPAGQALPSAGSSRSAR